MNNYDDESAHTACKCKKCSLYFQPEKIWWVEQGMYSEKVTKCPHCECINVIKYQDGFNQNPNWDDRYFK